MLTTELYVFFISGLYFALSNIITEDSFDVRQR